MTKPLGTIKTAAFFDREGIKHNKRAAEFDELADRAKTTENRGKFRKKAQDERKEAIANFEKAKVISGKRTP